MSMILARQGDNRTLEDFKAIFDYNTDDIKTKNKKYTYTFGCLTDNPISEMIAHKKIFGKICGRQYVQMIISATPVHSDLSDDQFMEMAKEFGSFYYGLGFPCNVSTHFDTGKRHIHLTISSVSIFTGAKFSQSISQFNRFKVHCNHVLSKFGFDIIKIPTEKMIDEKEYSFSDGYDFLEAYDEIAQDVAFNFYDICENSSSGYSIEAPAETSSQQYNPDAPSSSYNRFIAAKSETYRDYYNMAMNRNYRSYSFPNAFAPKHELRPMQPFNSVDMTPAIFIRDMSAGYNGSVAYFEDPTVSRMHIDYRKEYDVYVPNTVNPGDVDSIVNRLPFRTDKEKNDAIRDAAAAKAALERKGNTSQVSLDISEKVNIHFNDGKASEPYDGDVIDVEFEEDI